MTLAADLASSLAVETYRRVASGLLVGITQCEEASNPLKELQTVELMAAMLQALDGLEADLRAHLEIDATLLVRGRELLDELNRREGDGG